MLGASVRTTRTRDVGGKVDAGVRRGLRDAADAGFAVAFDEAPSGATNTLKSSGFQPTWRGDTLVWGFTADHARFVEEGTRPHWPPPGALDKWARRVLGDEDAAFPVARKIAREGTEGQHFVRQGFETMAAELRKRGLSDSIDAELR